MACLLNSFKFLQSARLTNDLFTSNSLMRQSREQIALRHGKKQTKNLHFLSITRDILLGYSQINSSSSEDSLATRLVHYRCSKIYTSTLIKCWHKPPYSLAFHQTSNQSSSKDFPLRSYLEIKSAVLTRSSKNLLATSTIYPFKLRIGEQKRWRES